MTDKPNGYDNQGNPIAFGITDGTDYTNPSGQDLWQAIEKLLEWHVGNEISDQDHKEITDDLLKFFEKHTAEAVREAEIRGRLDVYRQVEDDWNKPSFKEIIVDLHEFHIKKLAALRQGGNGEGAV